ncbi:MAG: hypothetical protein KGR16_03325 [Verrucomicrobia bacterium]|nr:hypothetical protein [Verrucomicrobiota bacterium]
MKKSLHTESDSKVGKCQGGALFLGQAKPAPKQLNLNKLSDAGGSQKQWLPTLAEPTFESRAV